MVVGRSILPHEPRLRRGLALCCSYLIIREAPITPPEDMTARRTGGAWSHILQHEPRP